MKIAERETWELVYELKVALESACRTIYEYGVVDQFLADARKLGVQDGIGVRARDWLEANQPKDLAKTHPSWKGPLGGKKPNAQKHEH